MQTTLSTYPISSKISRRISMLKAIFTVMVLYIHAYSTVYNFSTGTVALDVPVWLEQLKYIVSQSISRCAVPGFFFLSALLLYRKPFRWWENLIKKCRSLLVPYVLVNAFWILFYVICQRIPALSVFFSGEGSIVANWGLWDWLHAYGIKVAEPLVYPFWYLKYLFILNGFSVLFRKIIQTVPKLAGTCLLAVWLLQPENYMTQAVCFWGFGCFVAERKISLETADRIPKWLLALLYAGLIAADTVTRTAAFHHYIHNLSILVGLVFWFVCATDVPSEKLEQVLLKLSGYSFIIYLFHELPLTMLKKICAKVLPLTPVFQFLSYVGIPLVILGCCVVLGYVLKRYFPKLNQLLTGK